MHESRGLECLARRLLGEFLGREHAQFINRTNPEIHYRTTGPEIWEQTEGLVTAFVAGIGTGGTISGVARYLKERNPEIRIVGADPEGAVRTEFAPLEGRGYRRGLCAQDVQQPARR